MTKYKKKIKITIVSILICIVSIISYFIYSFEKNSHITDKNFINSSEGLDANMPGLQSIDGITNILLLGSDARTLDEKSRSDAIMILTIDDVHKNLKLTSIMRDSYVKIPGYGEEKINHSFAYGGTNLLLETIENNFSIKVDKYAIINFFAFQDLVDTVGGLDINVKPNEVTEINKYIQEVNGNKAHLLKESGLQHLDGQQTLSYSRIRHVGNGGYERTQRQRHVITLLIDKLKDTQVIKYPVLASQLIKYVKTNMDIGEILNYVYTAYKINNFNINQLQMPLTELSYGKEYRDKGWVLLMDKPQNAKILNDFIFEDKLYNRSDLDYASCKEAINSYLVQIDKSKDVKYTENLNSNNPQTKKESNKNSKNKYKYNEKNDDIYKKNKTENIKIGKDINNKNNTSSTSENKKKEDTHKTPKDPKPNSNTKDKENNNKDKENTSNNSDSSNQNNNSDTNKNDSTETSDN
ncbi:LCP family protein [Clostridium sp. MB40-C1]|uniref:LCP family protein n=1 Tax=Clostridium sp. MB40-C1 TaxID=3070996 RepID=UPI0027E1822A|nr:LCP family protein [Clostridium sp. MB40-C1]WMJ80448.1 LCP family protein [Clostridium sp. MB40-C1]